MNLPTSSLWLCVYCCLNFVYVYKKEKLHLEIISAEMYCKNNCGIFLVPFFKWTSYTSFGLKCSISGNWPDKHCHEQTWSALASSWWDWLLEAGRSCGLQWHVPNTIWFTWEFGRFKMTEAIVIGAHRHSAHHKHFQHESYRIWVLFLMLALLVT